MSQQAGASASPGVASSSYTKYASLPDVDTSAPDVYEYQGANRDTSRSGRQRSRKQRSADDTDSETSSDESDRSAHRKHAGDGRNGGASDDIDKSSLTRNDAAAKFSGATHLDASSADFSGRLHKRRPTRKANSTRPRDAGFETATYAIEGAVERGQESVADRLRRLKFEASQLEEELSAGAAASKEAATPSEQVDSAEVLSQLKVLQGQLANLAVPSSSSSVDPSGGEGKANKEALRALLQQVKSAPSTTSTADAPTRITPAASEPRAVADLVQVEARLSELESTLGLEQALLDESKPVSRPVLTTLARLEHQLSILSQPRHLDAISRRVKVLVTEMDRVHDVRRKLTTAEPGPADTTSTGTLTPAELTQLQQLFAVSTRLEPLLPVIPSVLTRLQTLAELHSSAAHFGSVLDELHESSSERQVQEHEMEALLSKIEANMDETSRKVEANFESLQNRIEEVAARLERVKG
ncbi:conserved hypothetical protein [Sporisorium reilianum SRZ2]|uniref:Dynactin subunit 2 n=1 Tax=Sporisorium reilianum (strain SRZ2) TaxID=999809 RepID=E6ZNE7_SPORE|nr:conserved hypothetical protein [Sporisorium reilianum SRZ2]